MNRLRAALRNVADSLTAMVEVRAHEIRTGITVIDAVAADDLNTQLLMGTGNPAIAHDVRVMALDLMKAGVQPDEIPHLASLHQRMLGLHATTDDVMAAAVARVHRERKRAAMAGEAAVDNATNPTDPTDDAGHEHRCGACRHGLGTHVPTDPYCDHHQENA